MHTQELGRTLRILVRKCWLTDSYEASVGVYDLSGDPLEVHEAVYGPLWEADQVERMVWADAQRLRALWAL